MARPERHDADYFPFVVKRGKTLNILQSKYGLEGIGFFTNLMRFLTMTPDHHYHVKNELDRMNLFAEIGITDYQKGEEILSLLASTGKIDPELWGKYRVIVSPDLLESLKDAYLKRNNEIIKIKEIRVKVSGNASLTGITEPLKVEETPENDENGDDNPQRIGKETKGKETENQFLIFYQNYPKKTNKTDASKTFNKLIKSGITLDYILSKLKVYEKQILDDKTETKYIRNPQRFLNTLDDFEAKQVYNKTLNTTKYCTHKQTDGFSCGGIIKGSACTVCFTNYDYEGKEL
jgi:hypothetical protein